jgi:hypothetical protein
MMMKKKFGMNKRAKVVFQKRKNVQSDNPLDLEN